MCFSVVWLVWNFGFVCFCFCWLDGLCWVMIVWILLLIGCFCGFLDFWSVICCWVMVSGIWCGCIIFFFCGWGFDVYGYVEFLWLVGGCNFFGLWWCVFWIVVVMGCVGCFDMMWMYVIVVMVCCLCCVCCCVGWIVVGCDIGYICLFMCMVCCC